MATTLLPRILLIEDSETESHLAVRAVRRAGFLGEIEIVRDGVDALAWLRAFRGDAGSLVLILLDLQLPRMDGFAILQAARSEPRTKNIPVVVFTSSNEHDDVARAYALGASAYVQKPIPSHLYNDALRSLIAFWTRCNQMPMAGVGDPASDLAARDSTAEAAS
jgi:two-component system, response regulator